VQGVNLGDLRELVLPLPSLKEQQEIVARSGKLIRVAEAIAKRIVVGLGHAARTRSAVLANAFDSALAGQASSAGNSRSSRIV
jgi:uncharacterized protein YbcC (UPF0753/DUF2309 family)